MKLHTIASIASLFLASAAAAAPVLNQTALVADTAMASFSQTGLAQSFMQSGPNISGAGIFLVWGEPGEVTISLYDQLPSAGGSLMAQGTAAGAANTWVDVFWTATAVAANTSYYLVFSADQPTLMIGGDSQNGYANGQVYANAFNPWPDYDYAFRTYTTTANFPVAVTAPLNNAFESVSAAQVSEPGTLALVGLALIGAAGLRRRAA